MSSPQSPGTQSPGTQSPGTQSPGTQSPGAQPPPEGAPGAPAVPHPGDTHGIAGSENLTQEVKMLAACAYLTWVMGFWVVGPLVIYFLYRTKSRFVAFHAVQALVVSVGLTVLVPVLWITGMIAVFAIGIVAGKDAAAGVIMFGLYGVMMTVLLVPMGWMVLGAYRAFEGRSWRVPLAWRVAERFTASDGQSPNQPSPFDNAFPGAPR